MNKEKIVNEIFAGPKLGLISGPCVIESYDLCMHIAEHAKAVAGKYNLPYVFKASFDKANRTSLKSYRGPGIDEGLRILDRVKTNLDVPILTDIHLPQQAAKVAEVADILQIPAFLCRQTDLILAAASTGRPLNIKKGQFMAPGDMEHVTKKAQEGGATQIALTERGTFFGYGNLVVDMRNLDAMREATRAAVIFDATHSVQRPSAANGTTGGDRTLAPTLARAAVAVGIDGLFCEIHPSPNEAKSDGPNSLDFPLFEKLVHETSTLHRTMHALQQERAK